MATMEDSSVNLKSLGEKVRADVEKLSLEEALEKHASEIAEVASTEEGLSFLQENVISWMEADSNIKDSTPRQIDLSTFASVAPRAQRLRIPDKAVDGVFESDGSPVKVYRNEIFENWGGTINDIVPSYTFVPVTRDGVASIVRYARANRFRVRCSGTRHSWTNVYGSSGEVLISMVELDAAEPRFGHLPAENPVTNELESIELVSVEDDGETALVKIGGAATSEHFRRWALLGNGDWKWMINALPILVEITFAGNTQVICHGAGINHATSSDFVEEIEIVNCKGEIQVISDREQLRAASGAFGLLGVVLSQTFRVNRLKIAKMHPRRVATPLAVPPIRRADVPVNDDFDVADFSDSELAHATSDFVTDAQRFYSEWFWFPYNKECWVHCWDAEDFPRDGKRPLYPTEKEVRWQKAQTALGELFQKTAFRLLPPYLQAKLMGKATLAALPSGEDITASVCDALHFRRGIHRIEVRDMEMEIPIPADVNGNPDFSICQKAWWMAISEVYSELEKGRSPMRVALEMRVMSGSRVLMASQRGNLGTCAIEVLSNPLVDENEWQTFVTNLAEKWATLEDPATKTPLNVRPHWAKEWPSHIRRTPTNIYLRETYASASEEFKKQLASIAAEGGYSMQDALSTFGNDTILNVISSS